MKAVNQVVKNNLLPLKTNFKKVKLVYCLCCKKNPVDYISGYEICPDCTGKL